MRRIVLDVKILDHGIAEGIADREEVVWSVDGQIDS